jgi:hypothetical protein
VQALSQALNALALLSRQTYASVVQVNTLAIENKNCAFDIILHLKNIDLNSSIIKADTFYTGFTSKKVRLYDSCISNHNTPKTELYPINNFKNIDKYKNKIFGIPNASIEYIPPLYIVINEVMP